MFDVNTGVLDRVIRVIVGLVVIAGFFYFTDWAWRWVFWLGLIPVVSGAVGFCPLYRLFGWSTSRREGGHGGAAKA